MLHSMGLQNRTRLSDCTAVILAYIVFDKKSAFIFLSMSLHVSLTPTASKIFL